MTNIQNLKSTLIPTPIGTLLSIGDEQSLFVLEFTDKNKLDIQLKNFQKKTKAIITEGLTASIQSIQKELQAYFSHKLKTFQTPLSLLGTPFQIQVWEALQKIPYGQTCSYADLAKAIDRPTAFRAVARANSTNRLPIIIPCHRVINASGDLGGYSCGLHRKKWFLEHEKQT